MKVVAFLVLLVVFGVSQGQETTEKPAEKNSGIVYNSFPIPTQHLKAYDSVLAASPCADVLAQRAVCVAANKRSLEIMSASRLGSSHSSSRCSNGSSSRFCGISAIGFGCYWPGKSAFSLQAFALCVLVG